MDLVLRQVTARKSTSKQDQGTDIIKTVILIDVDGTLVGPYHKGKRQLRPTALSAIKMLSEHAPVFLWSIVGADNGERLIREFPELEPFVAGCYGKGDFPLEMVERPYCIDDDGLDDVVFQCNHVILNETYNGGPDSGLLMEAARSVVRHMSGKIV